MRYVVIFVLLLVFSCKEDSKKTPENKEETKIVEVESKELEVILELKTDQTSDIKLMLNKIPVDEFQSKNIHIVEKLQPTTAIETIRARFGADNFSKTFLINLGNKVEKNITVKNITMSYGGNVISISPSEMSTYFVLNKFIQQQGNVLKVSKIEGKLTPTLILKQKAINILLAE